MNEERKRRHVPGHRYEVCVNCGLEWNVSLNAPLGWYICPRCEGKLRRQAPECSDRSSR